MTTAHQIPVKTEGHALTLEAAVFVSASRYTMERIVNVSLLSLWCDLLWCNGQLRCAYLYQKNLISYKSITSPQYNGRIDKSQRASWENFNLFPTNALLNEGNCADPLYTFKSLCGMWLLNTFVCCRIVLYTVLCYLAFFSLTYV